MQHTGTKEKKSRSPSRVDSSEIFKQNKMRHEQGVNIFSSVQSRPEAHRNLLKTEQTPLKSDFFEGSEQRSFNPLQKKGSLSSRRIAQELSQKSRRNIRQKSESKPQRTDQMSSPFSRTFKDRNQWPTHELKLAQTPEGLNRGSYSQRDATTIQSVYQSKIGMFPRGGSPQNKNLRPQRKNSNPLEYRPNFIEGDLN